MAAQFQITLADRADEAALRRRMAEDHMQGDMVLSFRRAPRPTMRPLLLSVHFMI